MRVLSFISKSRVELYTHLVPGEAFFLQSNATATSKIIRIIHYTMVFASNPFGLYNTNADGKTFDDEVWSYAE